MSDNIKNNNQGIEQEENNNSLDKKEKKDRKKLKIKEIKLEQFTRPIGFLVPLVLILYVLLMPAYQKQMLINMIPFQQSSENKQLESMIDKSKIVELPAKEAENMAIFLEEFNRFDDFQQNPNYGNLLNILDDIEIQAEEENEVIDKMFAKKYKNYINKKLFEESALESEDLSNDEYTNDEYTNDEVTEVEQ